MPQSPASYFRRAEAGTRVWIEENEGAGSAVYVRRTADALYAFPLQCRRAASRCGALRRGGVGDRVRPRRDRAALAASDSRR